jgi:alkylated DNA repair dioxygenase AlkB
MANIPEKIALDAKLDLFVTQDLFANEGELRLVPMQDAEIHYLPSMRLQEPADTLLRKFIANVPWRAERVIVWGKSHPQPRLIAWFGDDGQSYTYSGIRLEPLPWTDALVMIRREVECVTEAKFNSVLLNYYRDHNDSMGFHSDNEPELGPNPVIASLSLGEQRTFVLKHKTRRDLKSVKLPLASGSLLVMKGSTQRYWKHGIEKESQRCGPRVNLTFRRILPRLRKNEMERHVAH